MYPDSKPYCSVTKKGMLSRVSHTRLFAYQVPRSKGFSGQEYWSGLSFPPPDKRMQPNFPSLTLPRSPLQLLPQRRHSSLLPCRPAAPRAPVTGHSAPHPSPQLRGPSRRDLGSACRHCVLGTRPSLGRRSCYHAHSADRKLRLREATHLPKHTQLKKKKNNNGKSQNYSTPGAFNHSHHDPPWRQAAPAGETPPKEGQLWASSASGREGWFLAQPAPLRSLCNTPLPPCGQDPAGVLGTQA